MEIHSIFLRWITIKSSIRPDKEFTFWPPTISNAAMQQEIDYLVTEISESDCVFIRNGKAYGSKGAVSHIMRKYKYLETRIDSAEKFIALCASESSMTQKPYLIQCSGSDKITSQKWLLEKLADFRRNRISVNIDQQ